MYERALFAASLVFLAGALMVAATAVPRVQRERPGLLGWGAATMVASLVMVFLSWAFLRGS